jgi:GNAT superfamily N-acetyltransferase
VGVNVMVDVRVGEGCGLGVRVGDAVLTGGVRRAAVPTARGVSGRTGVGDWGITRVQPASSQASKQFNKTVRKGFFPSIIMILFNSPAWSAAHAAIISDSGRIIDAMLEFVSLNAAQTRPIFGEIIDIYQAVFSQPPYHETLPDFINFAGRLSYHAHQPGFCCVVARPPGAAAVGYAYGFDGQAGSWFYNVAAQQFTPTQKEAYLSNYFEFAELALLPAWRGQGAGGRLHDALLAGARQRTACLSTLEIETNALHLYHKRGWETLAGGIELPTMHLRYQIMGKTLKALG